MTYDFLSSEDEEIRRSAEQLFHLHQDTELVNKTLEVLFNDGWIPPNDSTRELLQKMRQEVETEQEDYVNTVNGGKITFYPNRYGAYTTGTSVNSEFIAKYINTSWDSPTATSWQNSTSAVV